MRLNGALRAHIVTSIVLIAVFSSLIAVPEEGSAYIPHSPVVINGNADFIPANGVVNGTGTPSDPFVIEGWEINVSGTYGIDISNTDSHFRISNVYTHSSLWNVVGISLIGVENGRIENTTTEVTGHGIWIEDSRNLTIIGSEVTSHNVSAISAQNSHNVTVDMNNLSAVNGIGVSFFHMDNSTIRGNFKSGGGSGIEIEYTENVTISGNTLLDYVDVWVDNGIRVGWSNNATIEGNLVSYTNASAMDIFNSFGPVIKDNTVIDSKYGMIISEVANAVITNNTFTRNGILLSGYRNYGYDSHSITPDNMVNGLPLYYHSNCTNVNVDGIPVGQLIVANCTGFNARNLIIPETDVAIQIYYVDGIRISSSTFAGRLASVFSFLSGEIDVEGNIIGDTMYGFVFRYSTNITISNNTATRCDYAGIDFMESYNIKVSGNSVSECGYGLRLDRTVNPEVWQNTFSDNYYGIYLDNAGSLRVYHNNFISNTEQAWPDSLPGYKWDDSYPSGGNYWSDYLGLDQFSGPLQDQPGSDGIGDTPYMISARYQDSYPLMSPFGFVHPLPPDLHAAALSGPNSENVTLSWTLSPDDGVGLGSVIGYEVYRNTTFDPDALGYQLMTSIPNGTSGFTDTSAGEGDPNNYFYQVCAVDSSGNSTCGERQAGKFTRAVLEGPNLVSIPLIQSDESIEKVLHTVEFDKAWTYDAFRNKWISYMKFKPYRGELKTINNKKGLWINVTEESNLTVAGIVPMMTSIALLPGWNLVGFPSFDANHSVGELKGDTSASSVEGFNASSPPYFLKGLSDSDKLETGYGYWVFSVVNVIWNVNG
jgi:parallel beta-helix repeat protein